MAHQGPAQACNYATSMPSMGVRRLQLSQCLQPPLCAPLHSCRKGSSAFKAATAAAATTQHIGIAAPQPAAFARSAVTCWQLTRNRHFHHRMAVHAQKPSNSASSSSTGTHALPPDELDDEDGFLEYDEDEFEEGEYEEGEDGFLDGEEDDSLLLGLEVGDAGPGVDTGDSNWAQTALQAVQRVLSLPAMDNLQLYVFRALPGNKLDIRLDRLDDPYGSPSIDDIEKFSRMLGLELEAMLGVQAAADISLEVSSPGAERVLRIPEDLARFAGLPLYVEYKAADTSNQTKAVLLLDSVDEATGVTSWTLADVRANAPGKGRKLSKRQRELVYSIPIDSLKLVRVHVDF